MYFNRENRLILLILIHLLSIALAEENHCQLNDLEFLTSFHPHLDAFWLNTDQQLTSISFVPAPFLYAMNQRNSKTILNSMLAALSENSQRKYFVTEVFFFKNWYDYLDQEKKMKVKDLLKSGQLEVVNGGWIQNDEAVCYYDDVLDQYSIGLHFLSKLDVEVKIGWATDSFGHSHSQVALQHLLGFQFQGIQRVDQRYIYQRSGGSLLEFYWNPKSDSNNLTYGGLVTQVRHFLHEVNDMRNTDPEKVAEDYKKLEKVMKKMYKKNKLFRFLGNDFEEFIPQQFKTLQNAMIILSNTVKHASCIPYRYGNPSDYLTLIKQFYSNNTNLGVREDDFMPNWDQDHYWSGFYTTNPKLKKVSKDFSRLVNLFRKVYLKYSINGYKPTTFHRQVLQKADELLAIVQHHDGITGTAKYNIEEKFIKQMQESAITIIELISQMKQLNGRQTCSLLENGNTCELLTDKEKIYYTILHQGAPKKERIQLLLPSGIYYYLQNDENNEIFCIEKTQKCMLVFQASLSAGENNFVLIKSLDKNFISINNISSLSYEDNLIKLNLRGQRIDYTFNNGTDFFNFSLVQSLSLTSHTETVSWNKYGQKNVKSENKVAGLYIMANTGIITGINLAEYNYLAVGKGKRYTKIYASSIVNTLILTIDNSNTHIVDLDNEFQPPSRQYIDYFLRVQSKVLPSSNYFYHDSNGYLVKRRQVNYRSDYNWIVKPQDKISANTYPACSFAYVTDEQKKLVIFLDRAEGVTLFDRFLMVNIDRLAGDDYKGAGEGYSFQIKNRFRHRVGLFGKDQVVERIWQRQFDEGLIGFYSEKQFKNNNQRAESNQVQEKYAKYTVFFLNQKQVVLRIINLNDKNSLKLSKYSKNQWILPLFGLSINIQNIEETFAHGNSISKRHRWTNKTECISIQNSAAKDTQSEITLSQLQIRSFKLTLSAKQSPIKPKFVSKIKMRYHLNRCF